MLIEKPARGDFFPIPDGGYALQYSPLLEFREGKGMMLFCQLDVNGRTENDPAADTIVDNILSYTASWKPSPKRRFFMQAKLPESTSKRLGFHLSTALKISSRTTTS